MRIAIALGSTKAVSRQQREAGDVEETKRQKKRDRSGVFANMTPACVEHMNRKLEDLQLPGLERFNDVVLPTLVDQLNGVVMVELPCELPKTFLDLTSIDHVILAQTLAVAAHQRECELAFFSIIGARHFEPGIDFFPGQLRAFEPLRLPGHIYESVLMMCGTDLRGHAATLSTHALFLPGPLTLLCLKRKMSVLPAFRGTSHRLGWFEGIPQPDPRRFMPLHMVDETALHSSTADEIAFWIARRARLAQQSDDDGFEIMLEGMARQRGQKTHRVCSRCVG